MDLYESLCAITGTEYVSREQEENYIYSRDSGAQPPRRVDVWLCPVSVREVQRILVLANREGIPVTPWGGGFYPLGARRSSKRGHRDGYEEDGTKILEVNEISRYALIEAGVSQAALRPIS